MYRLDLKKLGVCITLSDKDFEELPIKKVVDDMTGEFLYFTKIITIDKNIILLAREDMFERVLND